MLQLHFSACAPTTASSAEFHAKYKKARNRISIVLCALSAGIAEHVMLADFASLCDSMYMLVVVVCNSLYDYIGSCLHD